MFLDGFPTLLHILCTERIVPVGFHLWNYLFERSEVAFESAPPVHETADLVYELFEVFVCGLQLKKNVIDRFLLHSPAFYVRLDECKQWNTYIVRTQCFGLNSFLDIEYFA
jgi:hypothetical protein